MRNLNLLLVVLTLTLASCNKSYRDDNLEKKNIEIKEIQDPAEIKKSEEKLNKSIETFLEIENLFPGKIAIEKKDANLDLDPAMEQFIVLIDELNLVTIVVADFNVITREYFVAWEKRLPLIYNSDFLLVEQDVLGYMHNQELVISGTTITNNNGLYIFTKTAPPKGIHIYYKAIFEYESSGTVEIVTKSRSLDYNESRKDTDKSYDILIEKTNILNENTVAIVRENWVWDRRRTVFFKEKSETFEQKINTKEKLRAIYTGSKNDFINFIHGEWILENGKNDYKIIIIENNDSVILKYNDGVEEYKISRSWKSFQKLTINLENIDVSTIPLQFNITLNSTDEFVIANKVPTVWDGNYTRMNNEIKNRLISQVNTDIKSNIPFTGIFKNVSYSLNFTYPEYSKTDSANNILESGIFSLLKLEDNSYILQLKAKTKLRSEFITTNYKLLYSEQKLESQIIRTIKIHEGILTTYGIEEKPDLDQIRFEQTEVISSES